MRAVVYSQYGPAEVLKLTEIDKPAPKENQILVRVKASSVNSADVRLRAADPFLVRLAYGLFKPRKPVLGVTLAGVIEQIGPGVSKYKVGDEIFGMIDDVLGGYAEYAVLPEKAAVGFKPTNINFEETAVIPFGAHTALHFLRQAKLSKGQKILIYGASGAVGTAAVQIAKAMGAEVVAICGPDNLQMVKNLGADQVLDYTQSEWSKLGAEFDVVFETVNKIPITQAASFVKKQGVLILGAALPKEMLVGSLQALKSGLKLISSVASTNSEDMNFISKMVESGELKPVIDKTFPLAQTAAAHAYVDLGHKKGNVAISIDG